MTPNEIETQRVRGQAACVLKSATAALKEIPNNMGGARIHLTNAQHALESALGAVSAPVSDDGK